MLGRNRIVFPEGFCNFGFRMNGQEERLSLGKFEGQVSAGFEEAFDEGVLSNLSEKIATASEGVLSEGRHRVVVLPLNNNGEEIQVAVKSFGAQRGWKDRYDRKKGSKAARSFKAAKFLRENEVGTPEPIACFERWEGQKLAESVYISAFVESLTSFKDLLIQIYWKEPDCKNLVSLLTHVAGAIRKMHDAGFWHRDLGNQNMELREPEGTEWGEVQFVDLNRGRIKESLSLQERAQDFSRIRLPSAFLDVLVRIYWEGEPPTEFSRRMNSLRNRFYWWEKTRKWRHPLRKGSRGPDMDYPEVQNIWIWDKESAQASITMNRRERKRYYPRGRHFGVILSVLKSFRRVFREYKSLLPQAFVNPVDLTGRFGMSLEAADLDFEKQRLFLNQLGKVPVLLRFCHGEGRDQWEESVRDLEQLRADGHEVMIALLQDRSAVLKPDSWKEFLEFVIGRAGHQVVAVEVCHAVNRMKWGVHSSQEQAELLEPLLELKKKFPEVKFTGPACIDFEYHYILSALDKIPEGLQYSALSHHLYVDRRGAPENFQGKFSTLEKCGLLKAIAKSAPQCDDRVVVSEVNWPIEGTGIWSPVTATYIDPSAPGHPLSVSEHDYGVFMLRYMVITVCSGFVDQIYWWRLVAHGFGLIDERAEGGWRERIGFKMLCVFLEQLGSATFVEKLNTEKDVYALRFERENDEVTMMWCNGRIFAGPWPGSFKKVLDSSGEDIELKEVGDSPVYLFS